MALLCLGACTTNRDRAAEAGARLGAAAASTPLPDWPARCRRKELSGVLATDPLDTALLKTDNALGRANKRIAVCGDWYDRLKAGLIKGDAP